MASDTPYQAPAASSEPPSEEPVVRGYGQTLMDLFIAPGDAFADLVKKPRVLVVLVLLTALSVLLTGVWLAHADLYEMVRGQVEAQGRPAPPREAIPVGPIRIFSWIAGFLAPVIIYVASAGIYMLIFNFMLGAHARFKALLSVLAHVGLAITIVSVPLTLLVYYLKGDWNVSPDQIIQASPAAFLDRATTSKVFYALVGKFNLFTIWSLALCAIGLGRATNRSTGSAATVVLTLWGIFAVLHLGWVAIFG